MDSGQWSRSTDHQQGNKKVKSIMTTSNKNNYTKIGSKYRYSIQKDYIQLSTKPAK